MPQITALMTTYNSASHLRATMDSILAQTYSDFEFLILDDGSTDNTVDIIKQYNDERIRLIEHEENKGVGYRLNQALSLINTRYIAKVDSDDISVPERFELQLGYLGQHPELSIVKSYFEYFTEDSEVADSERFHEFRRVREREHNSINTPELISTTLMRYSCVIHTSYFAYSDVVKTLGYEPVRVGEDYSLFFRAVKAGIKIGCVPEKLVQMRLSNSSVTTKPDSAMHFADTLCRLKISELNQLAKLHGQLWLYGTGALAKALLQCLRQHNIECAGFIDRTAGSIELPDVGSFAVLALNQSVPKGVIIAAQPVRNELSQFFIEAGWREWTDFMVIA
ncbi:MULTISPECIES: glycosyltransferase family 2 protein [Rheinheimera]|uniref:Glycosyltransferase 2-like domain-containing protein n=1 Tax=Rheinheimera aquimaris TaxID=412437 RepID=A0ABP3NA99_9GAMM|nr:MULTISPECIES: glycosyltransferase family 2 protein [Rheinheimera]MCB5212661.1 glycosyltransferase [Rheinheimera aquimaris]